MIKHMAVAVAMAVAVSGGGAVPVAVPVAGLTKRFFNHTPKRFLNQCVGLVMIWRQARIKGSEKNKEVQFC